jgi:hypothetical protein
MQRRTITFREKVYARFTRRAQSQCWWWDGSLKEGRPALNLRHVTRYIYEQEIAPIPPGMRLYRTDHDPDCQPKKKVCAHFRCVNPWHVRVGPGKGGIYERDVSHDLESSERAAIYKRRVRGNRQEKEIPGDNRRHEGTDGAEGLASHPDEGGGA